MIYTIQTLFSFRLIFERFLSTCNESKRMEILHYHSIKNFAQWKKAESLE